MMGSRKEKQHLLKSLLVPLVREWGYEEIRRYLVELEAESHKHADDLPLGEHPRQSSIQHRMSAVNLANRAATSELQKPLLVEIASKFDARTFLPNGVDVRHFLEMRGQSAGVIKKRQDSFRKVLAALLTMTDDELRALAETDAHSGPTQLGPLSDAIKATGAAVRTPEVQTDKHHEEEGDREPR